MTLSNEHIVNEMVKLIKSSPRDEAIFFEEEKNHKWFLFLLPHEFFKLSTIKSRVIEGESYHYPHWPQGIYIETIAKQIFEKKITDESFIRIFVEVLRDLFQAKDNLWAIRAIFRSAFFIPPKYLLADDIIKIYKMIETEAHTNRFIEFDVHESYFHIIQNLDDNEHDRSFFKEYIRHLLGSNAEESFGIRERKLVFFRDHSFKTFSEKFLTETKSKRTSLLLDIVSVVTDLLAEHLKKENIDNTTTLWRPAVEAHYQNQYKDSAPSIFTAVLFGVSKILLTSGIIPNELQNWKTSDKNTFVRIYISLATAYPSILDRDDCAKTILVFGMRHQLRYEVYHFLNKNFDLLSADNQNNFLEAIRNLTSNSSEDNDPKKPLFTAWKKMRWLQAIKNSKNEDARKLYEATFKITNGESDHPDFDSYMSSVKWGFDSPLTIEDLDQLKPSEIIQRLSEFKEKKNRFGEPLTEGLSRTFESFVIKEPVKCSALIKDILTLPALYVSSLFDGYTKCWTDSNFVPVEELIDLAVAAFDNESFCKELIDKNSKARWAASSVFRFISAGIRDDEKAFDPKLNDMCYEVLKKALTLVKPDEDYKGSSDALTRAINEPRGVLFESAILLALRQARLCYNSTNDTIINESEFKNAWVNLFELIKNPLQVQDEREVSLHAHIGALYRQFMFLDKDWLYKNIDIVCPSDSQKPELWSSFIQGFCYVTVYVKEMYSLLNSRGYLLKFLRLNDEGQSGTRINTLQEHIIRLATIAVLLKDESLNHGLLKDIFDTNDGEEWNSIIRSLPRLLGEEPDDEIFIEAKKIVSFLLDKFDSVQDKDKWKKHFEGIGWLLKLFRDPSDELVKRIIAVSAFYSNAHWDHYEIVEYLEPFRDSHTEVVGSLYLELLKSSKGYPAYPEEKIVAICSSLKTSGKKEILADICRFYSDKLPTSKLTEELCAMI